MNFPSDYPTIKSEQLLMLKEQMNWPNLPNKDDSRGAWDVYQFQLKLRHNEIRRYLNERR